MPLPGSTTSEPSAEAGDVEVASAGGLAVPVGHRGPGRRVVVSYLLTVLSLITLNFFLPRALPGDPISALTISDSPSYLQNDATRAKLIEYYGLDRPLWVQYRNYLGDLAHGNLGASIRYNVPVRELIGERLPWTLLLITSAMVPAVLIGWTAGVHSAWHRSKRTDRGLLVLFLTVHSFPVFLPWFPGFVRLRGQAAMVPSLRNENPFRHLRGPRVTGKVTPV